MNLSPTADDKVEALVGLVLQAVDQRLTTVREQLAELTNTVSRRHAELQNQIAECRDLISAAATAGPVSSNSGGPGASNGASIAADAGAAQLLQAANMLTERVTFLESRVNQYTNDRVAELRSAMEAMLSASPSPVPMFIPLAPLSPVAVPARSRPAVQPRSAAVSTARREAPADVTVETPSPIPPSATEPAANAAADQAPANAEFDLDAFSAQLNARLSALVERAIAS